MGIPAFYPYIVRNHAAIIKHISTLNQEVQYFFLDANSIIYESYYGLKPNPNAKPIDISREIIRQTISKIEQYIAIVKPTRSVYIAFDGIAPVAKLEQQRTRRYKSWYLNELSKQVGVAANHANWNTAQITPGTPFMQMLNREVHTHFAGSNDTVHASASAPLANASGSATDSDTEKLRLITVSGSDEVGEGEHKIFAKFRENAYKNETCVVYGLDADLIMLSLNHLKFCPNILLFRETPAFVKSLDINLEPNENYLLDITQLNQSLNKDIKTDDYILLCFLLGNDFLPHFPSINIRTDGIDKLIETYKNVGLNVTLNVTINGKIFWQNLLVLFKELAKNEEHWIQKEDKMRQRKSTMQYSQNTPEERYKKIELIPTYECELERYIDPHSLGWQERYYKTLFKDNVNIEDICLNFLEGLEWTFRYYTQGCCDWQWKYKYNYPPLLEDLVRYCPVLCDKIVFTESSSPVDVRVQLCYVLPFNSLNCLQNPKLEQHLLQNHANWYKSNCNFIWAYCKYLWEAHVDLEEIGLEKLNRLVKQM